MTILRRVRQSIFIGVFALGFGGGPVSAQMIPDLGGFPVSDTILSQNLYNSLLGSFAGGVGVPVQIGTTKENVPIYSPTFGSLPAYNSLTGYFEKVWWPRFVASIQLQTKQLSETMALGMASNMRGGTAGDFNAYRLANGVEAARLANDYAGREVALCDNMSMGQSDTAMDIIARAMTVQSDQMAVMKAAGDPAAPGPVSANGPTQYALEMVKETNAQGTCFKNGNAGGNDKWCTNGKSNLAPPMGYHVMATTILGQTAFVGDKDKPNNLQYAAMFLNRLFPSVFSPVRKDLLNPLSAEAAEVLLQQDAYNAGLSVFQYPYRKLVSENMPQSGSVSRKYLEEALKRGGVTDTKLIEEYLGKGGTTKAGADRVQFLDFYRDPRTKSEKLTSSYSNMAATIAITNMQAVTLLYEIREEMKTNNALLGALGSMLTRDQYKDLQATTRNISAK